MTTHELGNELLNVILLVNDDPFVELKYMNRRGFIGRVIVAMVALFDLSSGKVHSETVKVSGIGDMICDRNIFPFELSWTDVRWQAAQFDENGKMKISVVDKRGIAEKANWHEIRRLFLVPPRIYEVDGRKMRMAPLLCVMDPLDGKHQSIRLKTEYVEI